MNSPSRAVRCGVRPAAHATIRCSRPTALLRSMIAGVAAMIAVQAQLPDCSGQFAPLDSSATPESLMSMSISELMNVEIYSVAQRQERSFRSASAGHVLSKDLIVRSGSVHVMDALRLAPGVHVAQVNAARWSIGIRGGESLFTPNLLVMKDGVSLYNVTFSGAYWNEIDFDLDELEQIEVVRGPGGSSWGANAVNGVINVISKPARETQGGFLALHVGDAQRLRATLRHGGRSESGEVHHRISFGYTDYASLHNPSGFPKVDDLRGFHGSVVVDVEPEDGHHTLRLKAEGYVQQASERLYYATPLVPVPQVGVQDTRHSGATLQARWRRELGNAENMELQAYYHGSMVRWPLVGSSDHHTVDLSYRHDKLIGERHRLLWSVSARWTRDTFHDPVSVIFNPDASSGGLYSASLQNDIALDGDRLALIAGVKLEHDRFTGLQLQPSLKLRFTPNDSNTVWLSVARAVRTPSIANLSSEIWYPISNPLGVGRTIGPGTLDAESLWAFEAGWRKQVSSAAAFDLVVFSHRYSGQIVLQPIGITPTLPGLVRVDQLYVNGGRDRSSGVELAGDWVLNEQIRVRGSLSYVKLNFGPHSIGANNNERGDLRGSIVAMYAFRPGWDATTVARYVSSQRNIAGQIPAYFTADLRIAWQPREDWSIAIVGRNLLEPSTRESINASLPIEDLEVRRAVSLQVNWHF